MSNNPGGANQFGNYTLQPAYGDVKRQTELIREAPMSGAPVAGRALASPRSAQRATQRPSAAVAPDAPQQQAAPPLEPVTYQAQLAATWQQIAATPGASPLVLQIAQAAQNG